MGKFNILTFRKYLKLKIYIFILLFVFRVFQFSLIIRICALRAYKRGQQFVASTFMLSFSFSCRKDAHERLENRVTSKQRLQWIANPVPQCKGPKLHRT